MGEPQCAIKSPWTPRVYKVKTRTMTRSLSEEEERLTPTLYLLGRLLLFRSQGHKEEKGRWRKDYQTSSWRFLVEENVELEVEEGNALEEENENKQVSELVTENEN